MGTKLYSRVIFRKTFIFITMYEPIVLVWHTLLLCMNLLYWYGTPYYYV